MEYLEEDSYCVRVFLRKKMLKLRKMNNAVTFLCLNNWSGGGILLFFCSDTSSQLLLNEAFTRFFFPKVCEKIKQIMHLSAL